MGTMESHNLERLKLHILPLSVSRNFDVARQEWDLVAIEISEEFDNCPLRSRHQRALDVLPIFLPVISLVRL
jgi:hypothetical protein